MINAFLFSLKDVLLQESKLHLVFEFLTMDLKKYLDSLHANQTMDKELVKVLLTLLTCLHI